jgi:hypothetical protein
MVQSQWFTPEPGLPDGKSKFWVYICIWEALLWKCMQWHNVFGILPKVIKCFCIKAWQWGFDFCHFGKLGPKDLATLEAIDWHSTLSETERTKPKFPNAAETQTSPYSNLGVLILLHHVHLCTTFRVARLGVLSPLVRFFYFGQIF